MKWKLVSVRFEVVLILTQDRCMVCTKHTIGSEISLDAPDGTQDRCPVCAKCSIGSEISFDATDGTPR